ncbi:MAG: hypothetical protein RMH84_02015 [Sulfolobales archaeon]|nr:hypothetical protein [Sulfolobales archaeon]MCX8208523.1 hypothetical protein [Sulfolobales archaeon]MDW8010353.1 hypothetical protein [Sulfolobales archaeon]
MVQVVLSIFGKVPEEFVGFVLSSLDRVYSSAADLEERPAFVEVAIYETSGRLLEFLVSEAGELGVSAVGLHLVSHEAWRGWPRIHVDYEKLSQLDPETAAALVVHEAVHSLVHGSRRYYEVPLGALGGGAPHEVELLYLASTAAKDVEVHSYLVERVSPRFVELYAQYSLRDAPGVDCSSASEVLALAKLVAPCAFVDCPQLPARLRPECSRILGELLGALRNLRDSRMDWLGKSYALVELAAALTSRSSEE